MEETTRRAAASARLIRAREENVHMCKPGASCGCGGGDSGIGLGVAMVAGTAAVVSAASLLTDLLLAVVIGVFAVAAAVTAFAVLRAVRLSRPASAVSSPRRPGLLRTPLARPPARPAVPMRPQRLSLTAPQSRAIGAPAIGAPATVAGLPGESRERAERVLR